MPDKNENRDGMSDIQHPFELLQQLASQCRQQAAGLPSQDVVSETWSGVGFRLAGCTMLAAMGEITEILHEPRYTALYEIASPEVLVSPAWGEAVEHGRWPGRVRPHTTNRRHLLMKRL